MEKEREPLKIDRRKFLKGAGAALLGGFLPKCTSSENLQPTLRSPQPPEKPTETPTEQPTLSPTRTPEPPNKKEEHCYVVVGMESDCSGGATIVIYPTGQKIEIAGEVVVFKRGPCGECQSIDE